MADDRNIEVQLKNVRLSFFDVFVPKERNNDDGEVTGYIQSANFLVPKTDKEQVALLTDAMKRAIEAKWPGQNKKIPPERRCVRDGEPVDPDTVDPDVPGSGTREALYDGYAGCFYVSANKALKSTTKDDAMKEAREASPVQVLGPRKGADGKFPRLHGASPGDKPYSGCYVDAIVRIYGYDGKGKNPDRVNASLEAIKFKRHGEAFGAKPVDADSMFDEEDAEDGFDTPAAKTSAADTDDLLG